MARQKNIVTLSSGEEHIVTPDLRDKLAAETYFRNNKRFGSIGDNAFRYAAFLAWSAGTRAGVFDMSWEQFSDAENPDELHAVDVEFYEPDEDDAEAVDGLGEDTSASQPTS